MITVETVVAVALRHQVVLDALGEALRSDLVVAHPYLRQIAEFADDFLGQYGKLPKEGDWAVWLDTLVGPLADGCKETLQRLWAMDVSGYEPAHLSEKVLPILKQAATATAVSRLSTLHSVTPEALKELAEKVGAVGARSIAGLAHLSDVDVWSIPVREDEWMATGFPTLDRHIGGWGKELWMLFADSKAGKTTWLQCALTNVALRGKRVLHVTLELGLRPQIHRYYRQIAGMTRGEIGADRDEAKRRLRHWFRMAKGEIHLLEYPAYSLSTDELARVIERVSRAVGPIDVLGLDYLDLMTLPRGAKGQNRYEDLGKITHAVRAYCSTLDVTVLTVSQANRPPKESANGNKRRLSVSDIGDSYQKVQGVDGLLVLEQTDEEAEVNQGRLRILLARDSGGARVEIPLYVNRDLSLIQELDHPNTRILMQRLAQNGGSP